MSDTIESAASYSVLGPVTAALNGEIVSLGGPRQIAVLARLLLSPRRVVSMEQLAVAVWEDEIPAQPHIAIRSYISNLRKLLEPHRTNRHMPSCFVNIAPGYRLDIPDEAVDWVAFEKFLSQGRAAYRNQDYLQTVNFLGTALDLWQGEPCAGLTGTETLMGFRNRLGEQRLAATELLLDARIHLGEHKAVIPEIEALIANNPLREKLTELAMLALYQSGRQSEALTMAQTLRDRLVDQLGIDPGQPIQDLEVKILNQDQTLAPRKQVLSQILVPPSLAALPQSEAIQQELDLQATDVSPYIGHAQELHKVQKAIRQLTEAELFIISGEPGVGKTNLIETLSKQLNDTVTFYRSSCLENDSTWLWPWTQILSALAQTLPKKTLKDLLDQHPALVSLLPQLSKTKTNAAESVMPSKAHTFASIDALLETACETKTVLSIEDIHHSDRDSVDLLSFIMQSNRKKKIAFIITYSTTEFHQAAAKGEIKDLARIRPMQRFELNSFSPEDTFELLNEHKPTSSKTSATLHSYCGGNPQMIVETFFASTNDLQLQPNKNVIDLITRRAERLGETTTSVLKTASLLSMPFNLDLISHCHKRTITEIEDATIAAIQAGLLVEEADDIQFRSRIIQDAFAASQSGLEKRQKTRQLRNAETMLV